MASKITSSLAIVVALLLAGFVYIQYQMNAEASVAYGNEYQAITITSADVGTSSIKSLAGSVGSIVVASTSAVSTAGPYLALYQTGSTTIATTSMTPLIEFGGKGGTTPPAGTYTFDVGFGGGIYLWVDPSFTGSYTITYR